MTDQPCRPVSVSRTINAPAEQLFSILTHTANHPTIDGSGMVRDPLPDVEVRGIGDVFVMNMYNDNLGKYEMRNHVVEYEDGRRLVWEPVLAASSHPEAEIGVSARYRWGFDLTPDGPERTIVTETFDCTDSPDWLKEATKGGDTWIDAMTTTLEKLEALTIG
jgi:Polyketide cyclase / dehydrase and lipid transport